MLIVIILLFICFFYEIFLLGKGLFLGDNLLVIVPHKIFLWENLKKGVIPLWNPNMWAGFPEVADITLGLFNPFNLLHFLFPDLNGVTIVALIAYFLAFVGTYLFLKNEKLDKTASLLGGIIFAFCGSMINISLDIIRIESICFLPWILLSIRKNKFLLTTFLLTLNFLVGQTQHYYMAVLFIFGFLLFFSNPESRFKKIFIFFINVFFSLLIGAFALLPQLELISLSSRSGADFGYNTIWSMNPISLIRFFFANFWGQRNKGIFWGQNITYSFGYIGFFSLIFIFSNFRKITKKTIYFIIVAIISLLISFGKFNPFYKIFFIIPGFSFFRNPSSWLIIYSFALACLTAFLADKRNFSKKQKIFFFIGVGFSLVGLLLLIITKLSPELPNETLQLIAKIINKNLSVFHNIEVDQQLTNLFAINLFILGLLSFFLYKKYSLKFLTLIIFLDLFIFSKGDLFLAPNLEKTFQQVSNSNHIKFLKESLDNYRFVSTAEFMPVRGMSIYMGDYFRRPPFIQEPFWSLTTDEFKTFKKYRHTFGLLSPNIFTAYNLNSINGYSSFSLKNFNEYFSTPSENLSASAQRVAKVRQENKDIADPTRINFDLINFNDPRLDSLSVKYILSDEKLALGNNHKEVYSDEEFLIYENNKALPRAQIFSKNGIPRNVPELIQPNSNNIEVKFDNYSYQEEDYLLLRDTFYPGWVAFDENQNELIIDKQDIFKKVNLREGVKLVKFEFIPKSFYLGLKISLISIALIFAFILLRRLKLFKAKTNPFKKLHLLCKREVIK